LGGGADLPHGVRYFVDQAHRQAVTLGPSSSGHVYPGEIDALVRSSGSILMQRDGQNRARVGEILSNLMLEAMGLEYNVQDTALQQTLLALALEMYSADYTPMRVLGATAEAMVRKV
jgi:hypothetical protein